MSYCLESSKYNLLTTSHFRNSYDAENLQRQTAISHLPTSRDSYFTLLHAMVHEMPVLPSDDISPALHSTIATVVWHPVADAPRSTLGNGVL